MNTAATCSTTSYLQHHEFELYLAIEDVDPTKTKAKSPQTNGICERFQRTMLEEFYQVAFRKKVYTTLADLQSDVDAWLRYYSEERPHSGRYCYGKTPMQTWTESKHLAQEKILEKILDRMQLPEVVAVR